MQEKYAPTGIVAHDRAQAQVLQKFLQELKYWAKNRPNPDPGVEINNKLYDLILDNIALPNHRTLSNLFSRVGKINKMTGQYFEDDLAAVISSVVNLASGKRQTSYKNFGLGSAVGTTDIDLLKEVETISEEEIQEIAELTGEELAKKKPGFVMGKIDTIVNQKIINMNASIDIPENLLEALSYATFTDKSYKSQTYDKTVNKQVQLGDRIIHLGNSNPYRAVLGTMASLGYTKSDTLYVFYGGRNIAAGKDKTIPTENPAFVKKHIYHLRYIYELTGAGILYKDYANSEITKGGAKFLVYNDPTGPGIYCVATSDIISQIINQEDFPDNPYGSIGISMASARTGKI